MAEVAGDLLYDTLERFGIYKIGGVVCFVVAISLTWSIISQPQPDALSNLLLIWVAIDLCLFSILGVFGARFGSLPYSLAGFSLLFLVVMEWANIILKYLAKPQDPLYSLIGLVFFLILLIPSYELIQRSYFVSIATYLLSGWKPDAFMTRNEISDKIGKSSNVPFSYWLLKSLRKESVSPDDVIKFLLSSRRIQEMGEGQYKRLGPYETRRKQEYWIR